MDTVYAVLQAEKLNTKCEMLEKNLSCLFKSAWVHLQRKEGHIQKLKDTLRDTRRGLLAVPKPGEESDPEDDEPVR